MRSQYMLIAGWWFATQPGLGGLCAAGCGVLGNLMLVLCCRRLFVVGIRCFVGGCELEGLQWSSEGTDKQLKKWAKTCGNGVSCCKVAKGSVGVLIDILSVWSLGVRGVRVCTRQ